MTVADEQTCFSTPMTFRPADVSMLEIELDHEGIPFMYAYETVPLQ